jgi:hypothetical protein
MTMKRWFSRMGISLLFAVLFAPAALAANAFDVYRDPSCGCCGAWVDYMRAQGYTVTVHQDQPMAAVKARFGVPAGAVACHTAVMEGCVVAGHVPVEDIRRLLAERPDAIGIAAPGMPMGSPGMEMGAPERYDVVLIGRDGSTRVYVTHGPAA